MPTGPLDALLRLESLILQAAPQWPLVAVRQQLARSIDVVVHVDRVAGRRRVSSICEVVPPSLDGELAPPAVRTLGELRDGSLRRARIHSPGRADERRDRGSSSSSVASALLAAAAAAALSHPARDRRLPTDEITHSATSVGEAATSAARLRRRPSNVTPAALGEWADELARSLRHGVDAACRTPHDRSPPTSVLRERSEPVRHRLERGAGVADACDGWADEINATSAGDDSPLAAFAAMVGAAAHLGGSVSAPLDRFAVVMRQRLSDELERTAQSAQARMSARVLTMVPLAVLAAPARHRRRRSSGGHRAGRGRGRRSRPRTERVGRLVDAPHRRNDETRRPMMWVALIDHARRHPRPESGRHSPTAIRRSDRDRSRRNAASPTPLRAQSVRSARSWRGGRHGEQSTRRSPTRSRCSSS